MKQESVVTREPFFSALLAKRMMIGGVVALALIIIFLIPGGAGDPSWGRFWMIRPLVIVPMAGATGAIFYHFMDRKQFKGDCARVLSLVLCMIVYVIGLWMGSVLGLDGTHWD